MSVGITSFNRKKAKIPGDSCSLGFFAQVIDTHKEEYQMDAKNFLKRHSLVIGIILMFLYT